MSVFNYVNDAVQSGERERPARCFRPPAENLCIVRRTTKWWWPNRGRSGRRDAGQSDRDRRDPKR
jgi:hypothetical protein